MAEPLFLDSKNREVPVPEFGSPVADTHAHLDMLEDPALAIARAARAGVGFIATVADVTEDARRTYEQLEEWREAAAATLVSEGIEDARIPDVRIVLGAHPHNAKEWDEFAERVFRALVEDPRTCAVGEMGLDYHYDESPRPVQRSTMRIHLRLAHEYGLPAVLHLREAHDDGLAILRDVGLPPAGAILHCYNLDTEVMRPFLDLGCHVSFAGPVTFKKAEEVRAAAALVPQGRILTETDCPFMAPEPFRGRTNEPALVTFTAGRMAEVRGESPAEFSVHTYDAARSLLDRPR